MKHSPGPWIAPEGQTNLVCTERDWNSLQVGALKMGFQAIVSLQQGEAQAQVDARLIAAAPEMLEALVYLGELFNDETLIRYITGDGKRTLKAMAMLTAAIAKATGESK